MNVRNFTYQGFDEAAVVKFVPEVVVPAVELTPVSQPIFTVEDMELAKSLVREEGVIQGRTQAEKDFAEGKAAAEMEEKVKEADLVEKINAGLVALNTKSIDTNKKLADKIGGIAVAIARKVCGELGAVSVEGEIGAIVSGLAGKLDEGEAVRIYLNAENVNSLKDKFTNASLNVDEKIDASDFRVEWKNGFAEKNLKKLWAMIDEVCARPSSLEDLTNEGKNG